MNVMALGRTAPDRPRHFPARNPRKTLALVAFVEHCPNRGGQR